MIKPGKNDLEKSSRISRDILVATVASLIATFVTYFVVSTMGLIKTKHSDTEIQEIAKSFVNNESARDVLLQKMKESGEFTGERGPIGPTGPSGGIKTFEVSDKVFKLNTVYSATEDGLVSVLGKCRDNSGFTITGYTYNQKQSPVEIAKESIRGGSGIDYSSFILVVKKGDQWEISADKTSCSDETVIRLTSIK